MVKKQDPAWTTECVQSQPGEVSEILSQILRKKKKNIKRRLWILLSSRVLE